MADKKIKPENPLAETPADAQSKGATRKSAVARWGRKSAVARWGRKSSMVRGS